MLASLQYGVGRPDAANTVTKTIKYFAGADPTQVLVALDPKAAFQNVPRRAMLHNIEQNDPDLAAVFSRCTHAPPRTSGSSHSVPLTLSPWSLRQALQVQVWSPELLGKLNTHSTVLVDISTFRETAQSRCPCHNG